MSSGVFQGQPFLDQGRANDVGNADTSLAGTQEEEPLIHQCTTGDLHGREDPGQGDARRSLDIVVE